MSMLSRVAEHIYWMARYIERAENTARLINVNTHLLLDLPRSVRPGWEPIIDITGSRQLYNELHQEIDERRAMRFLVTDPGNPGSILSSLGAARENARAVRDILPRGAWEQVNRMYLHAKNQASQALVQRDRYGYLRDVILNAQTMTGLLAGSMTHDEGYHFLRIGRNLERADMTTRIVDVRSANLLPSVEGKSAPYENMQWMSVLKSLTAYQMYRRTVRMRVRRPDVLKYLLQDRKFPRAFYHGVCEVETALRELPNGTRAMAAIRLLQQQVLEADFEQLSQAQLHQFIDELQSGLCDLHDAVVASYFSISKLVEPTAVRQPESAQA